MITLVLTKLSGVATPSLGEDYMNSIKPKRAVRSKSPIQPRMSHAALSAFLKAGKKASKERHEREEAASNSALAVI